MEAGAQAKLLYAAVGAALDCGATPEQVKKLFSAKNVKFVTDLIAAKGAAARQG